MQPKCKSQPTVKLGVSERFPMSAKRKFTLTTPLSPVPARIKKVILSLAKQPLLDLKEKIDEEKATLEEWQKQDDRERE